MRDSEIVGFLADQPTPKTHIGGCDVHDNRQGLQRSDDSCLIRRRQEALWRTAIQGVTAVRTLTTICWWWRMIFTTAKQDFHTKVSTDQAFALTATDYKDPPTILRGGVQHGDYGTQTYAIGV